MIRAILRKSIVEAITFRCGCSFTDEDLGSDFFSCRTSQTTAIFRSSATGVKGNDLIGYIQDWVVSNEPVVLEWFVVDVYDFCPSRMTSLHDEDCQIPEANNTELY